MTDRRAVDGLAPEPNAPEPDAPEPNADQPDAEQPNAPEPNADQLSLTRRLRQPRTILSIVIPLVLLVLIFRVALDIDIGELAEGIGRASLPLLLAAFLIHYLGFPVRGLRWAILLRGTGFRIGVRDATEIIFLSWLVNCLVPAKLGDVYRAYLLKLNSVVSLSRTFGTVFIERVLDLYTITLLGLAAGFWSFRSGLPQSVQIVAGLGAGVLVVLGVGLLTMRNFGRRLIVRLPLPSRVLELYDKFEEGVFGAIGLRGLPLLVLVTVTVWATEALRLFLVLQALDLPGVNLGLSGAFFVALIASLLTAVPLTPAGLGVVEGGMVAVMTVAYGIAPTQAATIAVVDRAISVLSVVLIGAVVYAVSSKRRGAGMRGAAAGT